MLSRQTLGNIHTSLFPNTAKYKGRSPFWLNKHYSPRFVIMTDLGNIYTSHIPSNCILYAKTFTTPAIG